MQDTSIFLAVIEGRSVSTRVQARLLRRRHGLLDANGVLDGLDITLSVVLKARQTSTISLLMQGDQKGSSTHSMEVEVGDLTLAVCNKRPRG